MKLTTLIVFGALAISIVCAFQFQANRALRSEVATLRERMDNLAPAPVADEPADEPSGFWSRSTRVQPGDGVAARLTAIEASIERWDRAANLFMERGQLPPSAEKLAEFRLRFLDANASDRDRLGALRMLRRNDAVTADVLNVAAAWLAGTTNAASARALLQGLEGLRDPVLFDPIYALATTSADPRLRDQALQGLLAFREDARVRDLLWSLATTAGDGRTQGRAAEMLRELPSDGASVAAWQQLALNGSAPLDQRVLSLQLLAGAEADVTPVAAALAQSAAAVTDKDQFLAYLTAFDDVNNPAFLPTVVRGAQSQDADIRRRAADALRDYRSDPAALQWLQFLAQSDPDPRVREEAARGLRSGGGGR